MFESWRRFNLILVTGPQRAGTTITARMVANDTGHTYVDEVAFSATDKETWQEIVEQREQAVIHCPGMCRFVHEYGHRNDVLVVLVERNVADIVASQKRIGWMGKRIELANYGHYPKPDEPVASVKYRYFDQHQRAKIKHWRKVRYVDLKAHPMYVPPDRRRNWHARQTA